VLVFRTDASGDAAPIRMLKGPRTGVKNPTSITLDKKNNELWVANFGNHTATVFRLSANGDVAPLRTIRSGPLGQPTLMIGNPGSVAYDTKREEILVPN
jgi:6-phosphogluconolactonase (cycloisomerase 2 family)